jgi:cell division protein FtsB
LSEWKGLGAPRTRRRTGGTSAPEELGTARRRAADTGPADPTDGGRRPTAALPGPRSARAERSRLTSRAAVLAVVLCAIALSLAYPVREYIAQRRQIDQLEAQREAIAATLSGLQAERQKLISNAYVEQQARDRLHWCLPGQTCWGIISPSPPAVHVPPAHVPSTPWYERLWDSVQNADKTSAAR